jgi:pimeloyl-ACP methyl ester carboxylesterase
MEGVGHFVMLEDPESFNGLLLEAVRAMVPGGP